MGSFMDIERLYEGLVIRGDIGMIVDGVFDQRSEDVVDENNNSR